MGSKVQPLIWALHDSVMVLAPAGWSSVELRFARTADGLRLTELSTKGTGAAAPRPKPALTIDARAEALRLSQAFEDLLAEVGRQGAVRAVVERSADLADWRLFDAQDHLAYFTRVPRAELDGLVMTDALFELLAGSEAAFGYVQAQLEARLASHPGGAQALLAHGAHVLLGDYFPGDYVWVWSWSEEDGSAPPAVRRVCAVDAQPAGLAALWRPAVHVEEGLAWALAGSVCMALGARGLLRVPHAQGGGVSFVAVEPATVS